MRTHAHTLTLTLYLLCQILCVSTKDYISCVILFCFPTSIFIFYHFKKKKSGGHGSGSSQCLELWGRSGIRCRLKGKRKLFYNYTVNYFSPNYFFFEFNYHLIILLQYYYLSSSLWSFDWLRFILNGIVLIYILHFQCPPLLSIPEWGQN